MPTPPAAGKVPFSSSTTSVLRKAVARLSEYTTIFTWVEFTASHNVQGGGLHAGMPADSQHIVVGVRRPPPLRSHAREQHSPPLQMRFSEYAPDLKLQVERHRRYDVTCVVVLVARSA